MKYLNITESTLQHLREAIVSGRIAGGERLNENHLASELGVSRPPLREAFRILENERLVRTRPRIGTFVTELSSDDFMQLCDIRCMAERFAIGQLKAANRTRLPELEATLAVHHTIQVPEAFDSDDEKWALFTRFANFHLQLIEAARNPYLSHWYRGLSANIGRYQYLYFFQTGIIAKDLADHVKLLGLIQEGAFDAADRFLEAHLTFQREKMMPILQNLIAATPTEPARL